MGNIIYDGWAVINKKGYIELEYQLPMRSRFETKPVRDQYLRDFRQGCRFIRVQLIEKD